MNATKEHRNSIRTVELFTGCGGLALGMSKAGLAHELMVEFNSHAASTIHFNAKRGVEFVREWPFIEEDVRNVNWRTYRGLVDVVAGGPPCQPFSIGGKATGGQDHRDMWPEAIRAVREIEPDMFIFENVRGLLRPSFSQYVDWISTYLERPQFVLKEGESLISHSSRIQREKSDPTYKVEIFPVNAADYGAPQKRHRVFFVGIKRSLAVVLDWPPSTHSQEKLVWDKWISEEYWNRHQIPRRKRTAISLGESRLLGMLRGQMFAPQGDAWATCRDAFIGLGEPTGADDGRNHRMQPGARTYEGHTGSPLDEPAKALKAGVHGVPGGENMLLLDNGKVRYFSIREAARLQGFDDEFKFPGSWTESMRQIGNAVPTMLAESISNWVVELVFRRPIKKAA